MKKRKYQYNDNEVLCFFLNSDKTNSRRVAILLNSNFEFKVHNVHKDDSVNYLILDTTFENMNLLLVNVYGPNLDTPTFYSKIIGKIDSCLNIIPAYYMIKNSDSMNYKHINNPKARMEVLKFIETFNLVDIHVFRETYPKLKRYT